MLIPSLFGLLMLLSALSRMRRELYGTGLMLLAGGLLVLLHTGYGVSGSVTAGLPLGWISHPQICVTQALHIHC
jgi:hypothetical protein